MHVYYKFGLLLIFILSVSICHTRAQPARNQSIDGVFNDDDYDDYYDDADMKSDIDNKSDNTAKRLHGDSSGAAITTTFRPIFNIPRRSNHVLEPICPRACHCMEDFKYVQCSHARLTHVPHDLPKTALIIDLSHNLISELRTEDFANCTKVIEINLNWNELSSVNKENFAGLKRLQRLRLANNQLTALEPNTFTSAADLSNLDLSNNSIVLRKEGSFLNQPKLLELSCTNCTWTQLYDHSFANLSSLTTLRLDKNDFNKKINTRAFTPLRNLVKLKLPELDESSISELCNLLKSIDNISFKHFDISCFELVLGTSFNESLIFATDPPFKRISDLETTTVAVIATTKAKASISATKAKNVVHKKPATKMASSSGSNLTEIAIAKAKMLDESGSINTNVEREGPEKPYKVPISPEAINALLISIIIIAVIGIIIGLICRKDVGGIKTKCCRTRKPEPKDQVHPTEEIPLNKLA